MKQKSLIFERDNYTCQYCGGSGKRNLLVVHHINYDHQNSTEYNEITLCKGCNSGCTKRAYASEDYTSFFRLRILEIYMARHWASLFPDKPIHKGSSISFRKPRVTDPYLNSYF